MKVEVANTHALCDPEWAVELVRQHYGAQFELLNELRRFASDLALRCLSSAPDDMPHHLVISVLFRQVIAAADAAGELLKVGAVDQAHLQLRALTEGRWGLIYALTDPEKWGRSIYVASLRENRARTRRVVPGTTEYEDGEYERSLRSKYGPPADADESAEKASEFVDALDAILARPENAGTSAALEVFLKNRGYEGPWYFDGGAPKDKQVKSVRALAAAVDALGEYDSVFKYASDHVHGGCFGTSLSMDEMGAFIAPIRTPEAVRQSLVLIFGLLSECCLRAIRQWRADEEPRFIASYAEKWRAIIRDCPDVKLERSRSVNR